MDHVKTHGIWFDSHMGRESETCQIKKQANVQKLFLESLHIDATAKPKSTNKNTENTNENSSSTH